MKQQHIVTVICKLILAGTLSAVEFHVDMNGADTNPGTGDQPLKTIQAAADKAQPGDTVTVRAGVYRERIDPPRGGTSDANRITYQAAPGAKVVITGSEIAKGWEKVEGNVWKTTLPNSFFGSFNPYSDLIRGDWCHNPRGDHSGAVYLDNDWLLEAANLDDVLKPDGDKKHPGEYLLNLGWIRPANGAAKIPADRFAEKNGTNAAPCSEGGACLGWIEHGNWVRYDGVDFGAGAQSMEIRAAATADGGMIEVRDGSATGELLGTCVVSATGGWQNWASFDAKIKTVSGKKNVCLVFKSRQSSPLWFGQVDKENTTIWAQFSGVNPNDANVEINARQTVFTPSRTGIDFITVRGFDLRNAATPWAPPTAGQIGIISAYWCKGWIIENNEISYSKCSGVALGKYSDEWDNRAESAEGYVGTVKRALENGWNKASVGSHLVRNNHIHHCEQTGIVGSLGCSFSTVTGNEIHDIHVQRLVGGAEMGGIKFHGAIDVVISNNHIYRCGLHGGIWLDWMAQNCHVIGNLLHDNIQDIFLEMQHGPVLIANNLILSPGCSLAINSSSIGCVHNLIAGSINSFYDDRKTPWQVAHGTDIAGIGIAPSGDHRLYNNICTMTADLQVLDQTMLPCFAGGNVFTQGTKPSKFDTDALILVDFNTGLKLMEKADGWYLTLAGDPTWRDAVKRKLVTTELLGKTKASACAYENTDGSPLRIDTDYFGNKRDVDNPFPGPLEKAGGGLQEIKVWPR